MRGWRVALTLAIAVGAVVAAPRALPQDAAADLDALLDQKRSRRVLELLDRDASEVPAYLEWIRWARRARACASHRDNEAAMEACNRSLAARPGSWALIHRAWLHYRAGRCAEAITDLDACEDVTRGERESGTPHEIRRALINPFADRWPRTWRKLEYRTPEGHYLLWSDLGVSASTMDKNELAAEKLDPAKPTDQRALEKLLRPASQIETLGTLLEAIRKEFLALTGLPEAQWPKDRVCRVLWFDSTDDLKAWRKRAGVKEQHAVLFTPEFESISAAAQMGAPTPAGISQRDLEDLLQQATWQLIDTYMCTVPAWLGTSLATAMRACRLSGKGRKLKIEVAQLQKQRPDGQTHYQRILELVGKGEHRGWAFITGQTDHWWQTQPTDREWAEAWAITYYLLRGGDTDARARFLALMADLDAGDVYEDVRAKHFPEAACEAIEKDWVAFLKRQ